MNPDPVTADTVTDDPAVARASALDTATLSDALDRLDIVGQCQNVKPRAPGFRFAGRAWTLRYGPAAQPPKQLGLYTKYRLLWFSRQVVPPEMPVPEPVSRPAVSSLQRFDRPE